MIRKLREIILRYRYAYIKSKIDSLNYSTSLSTSCAVPVLRMRRTIWMVQTICIDNFEVEHHWIDNEEHLKNFVTLLDSSYCVYDIKEYSFEL